MLDINLIRENPELVKTGIQKKKANPQLVDDFLALDQDWRKAQTEANTLRSEQKKLGDRFKDLSDSEKEGMKKMKTDLQALEEKLSVLEKERDVLLLQFPNIAFDSVPVGKDESENVVLKKVGEPTKFDFEPKDHMVLGEALGIIDTRKASEISGARFGYLLGAAARMEFAIVQHVFSVLGDENILKKIADTVSPGYSAKPFIPVVPPVMIRPEVFQRMGRLEPKEERYYIPSDDAYLIGSAEHTLGPLHMDETIPEANLPIRYIGFSTSFRREAGSYGKDTKGILRMHQFDKLEMETFTTKENSLHEQNFIVGVQEYLLQSLELPYQVVEICTGDMGGPDARQIDMETWMPGQGRYRETHTSDLMTDFQARRLNIRVKRANGDLEFIHMNDATAFAIGRILIALLENNQLADGRIRVPRVLVPYVGQEIIG